MKKYFMLVISLFSLFFSVVSTTKTTFHAENDYTFYCGSASSCAKAVTCSASMASVYRFFLGDAVHGQSTTYTQKDYQEIVTDFHAEILFCEQSAGVVSYYCFSHDKDLAKGVNIGGYTVNLHIAVRENGAVAVGTPIIFGGF